MFTDVASGRVEEAVALDRRYLSARWGSRSRNNLSTESIWSKSFACVDLMWDCDSLMSSRSGRKLLRACSTLTRWVSMASRNLSSKSVWSWVLVSCPGAADACLPSVWPGCHLRTSCRHARQNPSACSKRLCLYSGSIFWMPSESTEVREANEPTCFRGVFAKAGRFRRFSSAFWVGSFPLSPLHWNQPTLCLNSPRPSFPRLMTQRRRVLCPCERVNGWMTRGNCHNSPFSARKDPESSRPRNQHLCAVWPVAHIVQVAAGRWLSR